MNWQGKKANFLGDSITKGHGVEHYENVYHQRLKEMLGFSEVRNYGVSGTRLAQQTVFTPREPWPLGKSHFVERAKAMDKDADLVIVFGGTNDFGHGDAPFGTHADRDDSTVTGALHTLCRYLIDTYPTAVIAICTPTHREGENIPDSNGKVLADYVKMIRETAEHYSLPIIDLYATAGMQPEMESSRERYMPDGLHPNDEGQRLIAERIASFLGNY